ncbi:obtusifoliol 14-alpha demethylase-like [Aegilops tauschii subsp. strangulata]|uniref:obtusifoliol 14-alpha demethylase-like n=1 Tax=Aegilops tauschii subsp. strangulata TaxID=200361 RepID=UPI000989CD6E|nr:obtusifoliol 14-alpha demethylase-like [Aegilops tauschii subsp. strangulata]
MELPRVLWPAFVAIFVTVVSIMMARRRTMFSQKTKRSPPSPPVAAGVPLLGVLPALLAKGPLHVIRDAHTEMGSVFTVRLLHRKVTFLVGSEVSSHFYQGLESEISQDEVSQFTTPTFGPGVAFDVDFTTRREQFRFFGDAMKPAKLREVEEYFARWGQSGTVDLKQELEQLVTLVASRCLFGEEVRAKMLVEVATHLRELNDGMRLVTILFPHLPIPAHRRRDRARARLGEIFSNIVSARKASYPNSSRHVVDDMLQCLVDSRYKDGRATTETEVVGMLVSALFAGQHTSSSTGTWTGARLLARANAKQLCAAVQEQERILARHGNRLDYEVLQEMDTLHRCVKEVLRLHPPAMMLLRHARQSFTVRTSEGDEYEVPEGRTVASPLVIHNRLPHVFRDPEKYEPDRFGPGIGEDIAGGAFSYTAFVGGRHACIGEAFAYMQIKVIWSHLLRNFEMEMVSPFPETDWNVVMPGPKGKVMVRYNRKRMSAAA